MNKPLIPIVLLSLTIFTTLLLPKAKYESVDVLSKISIPDTLPDWQSRDITDKINPQGLNANYISKVFAREYTRRDGRVVYLIILDAGNFHHPKICVGGAGYQAREQQDIELNLPAHSFKAQTLYFHKDNEGFLTTYWLALDKKVVDWSGQKIREFWHTLLNKKKAGLMVRMDVPSTENGLPESVALVQDFVATLASRLTSEQGAFIFGQ